MYIRSEHEGRLLLKAQDGFDVARYSTYEITSATFAGSAVTGQTTRVEADVRSLADYRDKALVDDRTRAAAAVSIPFPLGYNHHVGSLGCVCLYGSSVESVQVAALEIELLATIIGRLYVGSLDRALADLRARTIEQAAFAETVNALSEAFCQLFQGWAEFESVSVFVHDSLRDQYFLRGSTGLKAGVDSLSQTFHSSSRNPILGSISDANIRVHGPNNRVLNPERVPENITHLYSGIVAPLLRSHSEGRGIGLGALIMLNKHRTFGSHRRIVSISWEDAVVAKYAASLIGVLAFQTQRSRNYEYGYNRAMHGVAQALQGALLSLAYVELDDKRPGKARDPISDVNRSRISDAIAFVGDVEAQVRRGELAEGSIELEDVELYDILTHVQKLALRLIQARALDDVTDWRVRVPSPRLGWSNTTVRANREALQCVFRNLVDNALKYGKDDGNQADLLIETSFRAGYVVVKVQDNGIGIQASLAERVFEDGFRARAARDRSTIGIGKGLADCRKIMRKIDGEIRLLPGEKLTTFEVQIPIKQ